MSEGTRFSVKRAMRQHSAIMVALISQISKVSRKTARKRYLKSAREYRIEHANEALKP